MRSAGCSHCVSACHCTQGDAYYTLITASPQGHIPFCAEVYALLRFQGNSSINLRVHQLYMWLRSQPSPRCVSEAVADETFPNGWQLAEKKKSLSQLSHTSNVLYINRSRVGANAEITARWC